MIKITEALNSMEQVVFGAILSHPDGATQDEIESVVSARYPKACITARFAALKRKGFVVATGEKRTGTLGRKQSVLKAVV